MIDAIGKMSNEEFEESNKKVQEEWRKLSTMTNEELLADLKEKKLEIIQMEISAYERTKNRKIISNRIKSLENDLETIKAFDIDGEPLVEDYRSFTKGEIEKLNLIYNEDK